MKREIRFTAAAFVLALMTPLGVWAKTGDSKVSGKCIEKALILANNEDQKWNYLEDADVCGLSPVTAVLLSGEQPGNEKTMPELPNDGQPGNGQTPPELSNGELPGNEQAPPELPDGEQPGNEQTPPELPGGGQPGNGQAPPELPDGERPGNEQAPPELPDGEQPGRMGGGQPGSFGGSGEVTQGTSANTISVDETYNGFEYTSTGDDENALRIDGAEVTLDGITVEKSAGKSSNTEDGDFYGMNAALLVTNGATATIKNASVSSSAQNGNGVFSYGNGTTVNISDSVITTMADNSGGIQTTGGGITNAANLTVETSGNSSAAIRSDRGGGTVNVDGGSYTTNGYNSPAVYSTASITVKNAALTAGNSEALVMRERIPLHLRTAM